MRRLLICAAACICLLAGLARAEAPALVSQVIRKVPFSEKELIEGFAASRWTCRPLAAGVPMQLANFAGRESLSPPSKKSSGTPFSYSRLEALTLGLDMEDRDRKALPFFSGSIIQDHIDGEYISIQVQVLRDNRTKDIYLYHQPSAAVGLYTNRQQTHTVTEQTQASARDFRGIGVYIKPGEPVTATNARTFVAINKAPMVTGEDKDGKLQVTDSYELVFVRARVEGDEVKLHTFGTSHHLEWLHYLAHPDDPKDADECAVKSFIVFTEYKLAGQVPVTNASRDAKYHGRGTFLIKDLEEYASEKRWQGGAMANLTELLDAIIDGEASDLSFEKDE